LKNKLLLFLYWLKTVEIPPFVGDGRDGKLSWWFYKKSFPNEPDSYMFEPTWLGDRYHDFLWWLINILIKK
jgi:hypothetical protein